MSSLVDDLDDDEIEASLLWTDDEDGDPDIAPSDEELLLSEPIKTSDLLIKKDDALKINACKISSAVPEDKICEIAKLVESENYGVTDSGNVEQKETMAPLDSSVLNETIVSSKSEDNLDTTLTDGFVDLNVTFNTRDALETSIDETTSCLTVQKLNVEEISQTANEKSQIDVKTNESAEETSLEAETDATPENSNETLDQNGIDDVSSNEIKTRDCQTIDNIDVSGSENCNSSKSSIQNSHTVDAKNLPHEPSVECKDKATVQNGELNCSEIVDLGDKLDASKNQDDTQLTVIDVFDSSSVDDKSNDALPDQLKTVVSADSADKGNMTNIATVNNSQGSGDTTESQDALSAKSSSPDTASATSPLPTIDDAIKSIRQEVSKKRTQRLSDEQEPAVKRSRQSSEPVMSSTANKKDCEPIEKDNLTTSNAKSTDSKDSKIKKNNVEIPKKKSIVSFEFKHYSKDDSTNQFVCKTCSMKFKEELKFESHLIASHAMALSISHFNIDLHQYYRQKKEKAISQSKSSLPRLDGNVDQALITEYNKNVKLITAQKNPQYFCKLCENIYSTKNLIMEHLKSPKHILCKKV